MENFTYYEGYRIHNTYILLINNSNSNSEHLLQQLVLNF